MLMLPFGLNDLLPSSSSIGIDASTLCVKEALLLRAITEQKLVEQTRVFLTTVVALAWADLINWLLMVILMMVAVAEWRLLLLPALLRLQACFRPTIVGITAVCLYGTSVLSLRRLL